MNITKRQLVVISLFFLGVISITYIFWNVSLNNNQQPYFEYIVQEGVSIVSIVEGNDLLFDCSDIYLGQKLSIPYPTPTPFGFVATTYTIMYCEKVFYIVQESDSVSSIANDYYIPKQAIRDFNGIQGDILTPGMEIAIPLCVRTPRYIDPTPTATLALP